MKKVAIMVILAMMSIAFTPQAAWAQSPGLDLAQLVQSSDRDGIRCWAATKTLPELNDALSYMIKNNEVDALAAVLLNTKSSGTDRDALRSCMKEILSNPELGFYIEIFSYTEIELEGGGFFYMGSGRVQLTRNGFMDASSRRNLLMHECFHSFNDHNAGPAGSLNEGSAIWVYKKAFNDHRPGENWAEATYGTKNYYRDIWNPRQPDYPLSAVTQFTKRLVEVYTWLSIDDDSRLPWYDDNLMINMYNKYFKGIDRNVDFYNVWMPAVQAASAKMVNDPEMKDPNRPKMPTTGNYITQNLLILKVGQPAYTINELPASLDALPEIVDGRVMLPIRSVVESLGGRVEWCGDEQKTTVQLNGNTIEIWIGKNIGLVNGVEKPLDPLVKGVEPIMAPSGRVLLPLRFISENLGCMVEWNQSNQSVTILCPITGVAGATG